MAQNPLVRAKLSIQKRVFHVIQFLETKWNISQDKLNRTVDAWLKVPINNQLLEENQPCPPNANISNGSCNPRTDSENPDPSNVVSEPNQAYPISDSHFRLRLKPSSRHELKEVNITRVVPDNHLDLSFNAYIKRFGESISKITEPSSKNNISKDTSINSSHGAPEEVLNNSELSQGAPSTSSRIPLSLTTPDSSILLERSSTSDQAYNGTAQKSINFLARIVGSFEGCENSRTAYEDTQDRSLPSHERSLQTQDRFLTTQDRSLQTLGISALLDEDAALEPTITTSEVQQHNSDSKSVDFNIPKNVLLGDWLKMSGQEDANDAFLPDRSDDNKKDECEFPVNSNGNPPKPQNHMIEIQKLAEGWTRHDEASMTIGELYLAFKCPEKIVLEYKFEQLTSAPENQPDNTLIFKLLTAASLSLAQIERQKQEKVPAAKLKRRKGPSNPNTVKYLKRDDSLAPSPAMTPHDIEKTNQRVEEALKQLQPTRLRVYRKNR